MGTLMVEIMPRCNAELWKCGMTVSPDRYKERNGNDNTYYFQYQGVKILEWPLRQAMQ